MKKDVIQEQVGDRATLASVNNFVASKQPAALQHIPLAPFHLTTA